MKLIILPGNSQKANSQWLNEATQTFSNPSDQVVPIQYGHWGTDQKMIDFDAELEKLIQTFDGEEYIIFAKSAGAMLTIYGVSQGKIKPERCVFVGLPLKWAQENNFSLPEWLEKFDAPTVLIQQTDDKFASFQEVQELLEKLHLANIELEEIPGSDHAYEDFSLFKERALEFLLKKENENFHEGGEKSNLK